MAKLNSNSLSGLLILACVVVFALLASSHRSLPDAVGQSASAETFSSGRALKHLEVIARAPHPIGSAEHAAVREYIMRELQALGVTPQVQKTTVVSTRRGSSVVAATVENIVARLGGTNSRQAVLLMSHYDSVPTAPGASDNGAGVASLLETLRALKSGAPLKNDVILLFTDGEENGLLGATAFVREHPWAKDAGVVINFEARGNSGPSIMFETSDHNGWLIGEFAKAAPYPVANSLSYDLYKLLPNDTDFTIMREAGLSGLNFAFIEGLTNYHSRLDSVANLNERSLQHHGSYALALSRHFGSLDELGKKERNAVYFNTPGSVLIRYSSVLIIPLVVIVAVVFVAVMIYGLRKKFLTKRGIALGFLACLLNIVIVAGVSYLLWYLISTSNNVYGKMPFGDIYNSRFYLAGFTALTIALVSFLYMLLRKKTSAENIMVGGLGWWLIILVLSGLFLPGGSYLFTWPLLFSLGGLAAAFALKKEQSLSPGLAAVLALCMLPGVVLFVPLIEQIFVALTVNLIWATMILVVLLLWLLIPLLELLVSRHRWLLTGVMLAASFALIGVGGLTAGFDRNHPEPYHLVYGLDADANQAVWASVSGRADKWSKDFFPEGARRTALNQYYYKCPGTFLVGSAPVVMLPVPVVNLVKDETTEGGQRILRLRIEGTAGMSSVFVNVSSEAKTRRASVNDKQIETDAPPGRFQFGTDWGMRYYVPQAGGTELVLEMESRASVKVQVVGLSYGLPDVPNIPVRARPDDMMPAPYLNSDSTMVAKTFSFE
ncbi:MAG TPA: M28 family metallopeptidase [Pyrinomonadaceae bacterium]|nr:M28 family metallopeptidase [Pyrinomonadaceae bacterium]